MLQNKKILGKLFSVIAIALLVAYALIVYIPHGHECIDSDCTICNMVDYTRDILIGASLLTIAHILPSAILILHVAHECVLLFSERTPVGLKVKLSD